MIHPLLQKYIEMQPLTVHGINHEKKVVIVNKQNQVVLFSLASPLKFEKNIRHANRFLQCLDDVKEMSGVVPPTTMRFIKKFLMTWSMIERGTEK